MPIILGGILAMALSPLLEYLINMGLSRKVSMIILSFALFSLGTIPIFIVFIRGAKAVIHLLSEKSVSIIKNNIEERIFSLFGHFSHTNGIANLINREKFNEYMSSGETYVLNFVSSILTQIPEMFLLSLVAILSFYFFLLKEEMIREWFDHSFYFSKKNGDKFISVLKLSCKEVFFSNVITGIFQACMIAAGAYFCKIGDFFIVFISTFILSFIPVVGAGPFGAFLAFVAFIDQRMGAALGMGIVAAVTGIVDNILRPYLNARSAIEVPLIINFFAIIGGVLTMGLAGLFIGPLLASLTFGVLPIIVDEYFPRHKKEI